MTTDHDELAYLGLDLADPAAMDAFLAGRGAEALHGGDGSSMAGTLWSWLVAVRISVQ